MHNLPICIALNYTALYCTEHYCIEVHCTELQVSCEEIVTHLCNCGPVIVLTNANLLVCRFDS